MLSILVFTHKGETRDTEKLNMNIKPNHTQIPNYYIDFLMAELSPPTWKVLCYIARRTFGFQKSTDRISLTQMQKGIKKRDGTVLDNGTGLCRNSILKALSELEEKGVLQIDRSGSTNRYKLVHNMNQPDTEVVHPVNHTSAQDEPQLVYKMNTQKKGKESIQKKENSRKFLEKLSDETIKEMTDSFVCTPANVRAKALTILDYCDSKGKTYKNYKATLRNWLRKDFGDRESVVKKKPKYELRTRPNGEKYAVQVGFD